MPTVDVVIVGAGMAGLSCADALTYGARRVVVLEARDRVGGRVYSRRDLIAGKAIEAGGEFLASGHTRVLDLAHRFGVEVIDAEGESEGEEGPIVLNGEWLDEDQLEEAEEGAETIYELLTEMARNVPPVRAWEAKDAAELDTLSTGDWLRRQDVPAITKRLLEAELVLDNAVAIDQQSLLANLAQIRGGGLEKYWTENEMYRCKGGNQQLAENLAGAIGPTRLRMNQPVARIEWNDRGVKVTCRDGAVYEAGHVVVTVPPSTWDRIEFVPALPAALRPQMGLAVKFLSVLSGPEWEELGLAPDATSFANRAPLETAGSVWWGTFGQEEAGPLEGLVSFVSGPGAAAWSGLDEKTRREKFLAEMEALRPGYGKALRRLEFMDWPREEWSKCGYSFPAPGQVTQQGRALYEGLGRLHFAGESTCYEFIGYIEGAVRSGVRAAKAIEGG